MGMETNGQYADTVGYGFVKEQCPNEYQSFIESLDKAEINFDDFCSCTSIEAELEAEDEDVEKIDEAWIALQEAFELKTGLSLDIEYHDKEDRGDDLDGGTFTVDGMYQLSPAGKQYFNKVTRKFWTTFG